MHTIISYLHANLLVVIFKLSNYNLNMDLIKSIHISSVEEAEEILKSEISVNSLSGELKHAPVLKSYGLTEQNVQTKINKIFREQILTIRQ